MCARSCLLPPVPLVPDSQFAAEALGESTDGYDAMGGAPAGEGAGAAGVSSDGYDAMGLGGRGGQKRVMPHSHYGFSSESESTSQPTRIIATASDVFQKVPMAVRKHQVVLLLRVCVACWLLL